MSYNKGKNNPNYKHGQYIKNIYYCLDCGQIIKTKTKKTLRCYQCWKKYQRQSINNGNYKNGLYCTPHYCRDCGKILAQDNPKSKRCRKCYGIWRSIHIRGNKIATFIDGKSHDESYPPKFSYYLKKQIRKRDNFICQLCNIKEIEFKKNHRKGLEVHHIDYNKYNCHQNNLITLYGKCNKQVNYNRDYWFAYFRYIMENKYGYK